MGGGNVRQVVSGLAKYFSPEDLVVRTSLSLMAFSLSSFSILSLFVLELEKQWSLYGINKHWAGLSCRIMLWILLIALQNRRVVLITNVKPGKLRDVTSSGLVCPHAIFFHVFFFLLIHLNGKLVYLVSTC